MKPLIIMGIIVSLVSCGKGIRVDTSGEFDARLENSVHRVMVGYDLDSLHEYFYQICAVTGNTGADGERIILSDEIDFATNECALRKLDDFLKYNDFLHSVQEIIDEK